MIGNKFENALWSTRFIVLISVVLSIISSIILFLLGGWDIIQAIIYKNPLLNNDIETNNELLFNIISSIDLFLIGIVLLIFGFGVYELFISEINFAKDKFADSTLKINSLDQLKNKIIKVIIIVLIVKFFEKVLKLSHNFTTPKDLIFFSLSILAICIGYFLINRK
ncbi:YqhA family protein [Bacteroidota bacterium]|nr:YqhA family protein [Bacteroidota bacterium]MDC3153628.1 YqhA family protein [Bacteroidota bacterium]|tara:strand:- start:59 stop:556 length:498 start_codon:yes stop_codon:yes gene_type:complete